MCNYSTVGLRLDHTSLRNSISGKKTLDPKQKKSRNMHKNITMQLKRFLEQVFLVHFPGASPRYCTE